MIDILTNTVNTVLFLHLYVRNSLKDAHVAARVGALLNPTHTSSSNSSSAHSSRSSSHTSSTTHTSASGRTAPAAAAAQEAVPVDSECSLTELKLEQCSISAAALAAMAVGLTASTSLQVTCTLVKLTYTCT
jgi:hypothetical protein